MSRREKRGRGGATPGSEATETPSRKEGRTVSQCSPGGPLTPRPRRCQGGHTGVRLGGTSIDAHQLNAVRRVPGKRFRVKAASCVAIRLPSVLEVIVLMLRIRSDMLTLGGAVNTICIRPPPPCRNSASYIHYRRSTVDPRHSTGSSPDFRSTQQKTPASGGCRAPCRAGRKVSAPILRTQTRISPGSAASAVA